MKQLLFLSLIIIFPLHLLSQGGPDCSTMEPICTNVGMSFTANAGVAEASTTDPGNDYDCLITQPNPTWYYFEIATNGNINMNLSAPSDIDFIIWGPFSSLSVAQSQCGDLGNPNSEIIDCSFSPTNNEFPIIPTAIAGQVYVMLITNYADVVQNVSLTQTGGTGSTDCTIITNPPCAISAFNVNVSGCDFVTSTYDVTGSIDYTDPPASGNLVVEDCNGNITVVDSYPFAVGPQNFTLNNLVADGLPCDVTAYFTADLVCTQIYPYIAPICIANCPSYDLNASSPNEACGNQIYSLEVQNSGCDGYVEFNVVGNYGSLDANEITWQVTSNLTTNVVASGGPGVDGANFNVSTVQMNPAVQGYIYTLTINDSWGDGFNGSGGTIVVQQGGFDLIVPITGNFGTGQTIMFQAPLVVSSSTMTVLTPSGPVSSIMGNCQDHEVQFTLANTNFCTAVQVDLPWTITCNNSGTLIASGIHTVTVYPQVPSSSSDVVAITWNTATCTWDVAPNNDCSLLDIGTLFNITPDPLGLSNYCATGTEVFNVDYIGLAGSPNCCSTAGPSVPITYSDVDTQADAAVVNSPFGGVNNSAFIDIAPNGSGGNAVSATLTVSYNGYCENIASTTGDNMWVTIYVDGFIIYDQQQTTSNFNTTLTLANMPWGYNENSVIEVYYYPNQLGSTVFSPGTSCGSLPSNYYNFSALNVSLNVVFDQQSPTPVSCTLPLNSNYTCCTVSPILATAPVPITVACPSSVPAVNISSVTGIVSDCPTTVTFISDAPAITCSGTIVRTYRVTDACGNFINLTQDISISSPIVVMPADGSSNVACPALAVAPTLPNVLDNCGRALTVSAPVISAAPTCSGILTYTYTYTNCQGTTYPWVYTYTISAPIVVMPAAGSSTVTCPALAVAPTAPAVIDNCGRTLTVSAPVISTAVACVGTQTYTYTYTSCSGATYPWVYTYTINDNVLPTASNPATTIVPGGPAPAVDILVVTTEADNCSTPVVAFVSESNDGAACPLTITRIYSVTDACGNTINVTHTILITDPFLPTATNPLPSNVECILDIPAVDISVVTDEADNQGTPAVAFVSETTNGLSCPEIITRTYSVTDICGGQIFVTQTITVLDTQDPILSPAPIAVTVDCIGNVPAMTDLTWTDNCTGTGTVSGTDGALVGGGCGGTITRTWTYTDLCGNAATTTQTITVDDNTLPTASNPATTTVPGGPAPAVDILVVTTEADNCSTPVVAFVSESNDGAACPLTITRIYSVTDACGNTINVTHTILITDPFLPTATNPLPINVECILEVPLQDVTVVTDEADNQGTPLVAFVSESTNGLSCPEIITRTYSVTDLCGGQILVNQTITVLDITDPVFVAPPAPISVLCAADVPAMTNLSWTDNCSGAGSVAGTDGPLVGTTCGGTITRTWTYTDVCGNNATVTQIITVNDNQNPVLAAAPSAVTINCIGVVPAMTNLTWTDNCTGTGTVSGTDGALVGGDCGGTITRTWTYTDLCGNIATTTQTITVDDNTLPTASNPATTTVPGGPAPAVDILVVIDEADNCSVPVVAFVSESSDNAPCPETITRIYSVTDACGNSINVTHTILITDAFIPTASNPITVNVECIGDVPVPDILVVTDEADNQGIPVVAYVNDVTDGLSCPETITRTYSVTDLCGNIITVNQIIIVQDITAPTASNPSTMNLAVGTSIPNPDVLVVTNEMDNCSANLTVTFVSDLSDGLSCPETVSRTYRITDDCGNFTTVSQLIIVNSNCEIVIPTAFTPNADLSNDTWEIVDLDLIHPNNFVFVYNRWGNLLFESEKGNYLSRPWDGKVNGEQLPVASYYYVIYTEGDKSGEILNGIVSIIKN